MGGFGAYQLAAHDPDAFNAVAVAAGYVLGTQEPSDRGYGAPQPASRNIFRQFLDRYAARLASVPSLVVVHSERDKVSSFIDAKTVVERVRAAGGNAHLVEVPEDASDSKSGSRGRKSGHQYCNYAFGDASSSSVVYSRLLDAKSKVPMAKKKPRLMPPAHSAVAVSASCSQTSARIDVKCGSSTVEGAADPVPMDTADGDAAASHQEQISSSVDSEEMADATGEPGTVEKQASTLELSETSKTQALPRTTSATHEERLVPPGDSSVVASPNCEQTPCTNNEDNSVTLEAVVATEKNMEAGDTSSEAPNCQANLSQDAPAELIGHDMPPKEIEGQARTTEYLVFDRQVSPILKKPTSPEEIASHKACASDAPSQASHKPAPKVKRRPQKPRPATANGMDTYSTGKSVTTTKTASSDSGFANETEIKHSSESYSQPPVSGQVAVHQDQVRSSEPARCQQQDLGQLGIKQKECTAQQGEAGIPSHVVDLEDESAVPSTTRPPAPPSPPRQPSPPAPRYGWRNRKRRTEPGALGSDKKLKSNDALMPAASTAAASSSNTCPVEPSSNTPNAGPGSTAKAISERLQRLHGPRHDDDEDVEEVYVGHVKSYTANKGIGFLSCAETFRRFRSDLFFHRNQLKDEHLELVKGSLIRFTVGFDRNGRPEAHNMQKCVLAMFKGVVKRFLQEQGYGFIGCEDEDFKLKNPGLSDIFFHKSHIEGEKLKAGDLVTFAMDPCSASRPKALNVAKLSEVIPTLESKEGDRLAVGPQSTASTLPAPTQVSNRQPPVSLTASDIADASSTRDEQTGSQATVVDNEGRPCDLSRVVVNFISVGSRFGEVVLKRDRSKFDYEGVRRCLQLLTHKFGLIVIGVIYENFRSADEYGNWSWEVPADIQQMCESIELTPRVTGQHQRNAHDEMTIKCAYRRNCRFLDNNNYKTWLAMMKDEEIRAWLRHCQEFLQLRFFFDGGVGAFDLLDGNIPARWCTAPLTAITHEPDCEVDTSEQTSAWPLSEHAAEDATPLPLTSAQPAENEDDNCNGDAAAIGSEDLCEDIVIQSSDIAQLPAAACDVTGNQLDQRDDCDGIDSAIASECGGQALIDAYMTAEECEEEPPVSDLRLDEHAAPTPSLTPIAAAFISAFDELPE
eukprot:TRINITY_DN18942_c0_g1_i1.p1 TRINITY_DN18942_c0_g1~~TRINITY_DN18942_c0_g1_i1.p1  ORF type:complete len:1138 (+),score=223.52 TRINITY_DN18942_c0_g1_i1:3-3416(+)